MRLAFSSVLVPVVAVTLALAAPAAAGPKPPLSHEGRWLTDSRGRVVLLHGVNMVYKVGSYRPADAGFGADDARFLRRHGFNTVRLGIIYKGLQPRPPSQGGRPDYRRPYLRSIMDTERVLAQRGIFSLLDFHQDLYNERFQGEGWPDWQVLDDGLPSAPQEGFPANYAVNVGLNRAFDNFWANAPAFGLGLQDAYARAWRRVAVAFADRPHVVGYDILNEPWPGSGFAPCFSPGGCPDFDRGPLADFTRRVLAGIREVDRRTLVFYEPLVPFDFGSATSHPDTGDSRTGFSFHDYCQSLVPGASESCRPREELVFDNAEDHVERTGDVPFLTEFGSSDELDDVARMVEIADGRFVSWQYWHYCDCADPTTSGPGVQALVIDPSKPPHGANVKRDKLRVLARPYPRAVAGTPRELDFDPETRSLRLVYSTRTPSGDRLPRRIESEVFLPAIQYPDGYAVDVRGARVTSEPGTRVLRLERRRKASSVTVVVGPRP
jgi:endoglycosylceramidase